MPDRSAAFRARLVSGTPLLLDAAMGTELARRGADVSPPLWSGRSLSNAPALVRAIHAEAVAAGAEVLTANTFRTHARNLARAGSREEARALTRLAVALARAAGPDAFVAGSLSPLEDCYRPDLVPDEDALAREHAAQAETLAEAGADLILVETMNAVRELVAAARAAARTGLPVVASVVSDGAGRLLSGETLEAVAEAVLSLPRPPDALGINCVPARRLGGDLARLAAAAPRIPLVAYANTGRALDEAAALFEEPIDPEPYAALAAAWVDRGARLVGGCCGTTAAHVAATAAALRGSSPGSSWRGAPGA